MSRGLSTGKASRLAALAIALACGRATGCGGGEDAPAGGGAAGGGAETGGGGSSGSAGGGNSGGAAVGGAAGSASGGTSAVGGAAGSASGGASGAGASGGTSSTGGSGGLGGGSGTGGSGTGGTGIGGAGTGGVGSGGIGGGGTGGSGTGGSGGATPNRPADVANLVAELNGHAAIGTVGAGAAVPGYTGLWARYAPGNLPSPNWYSVVDSSAPMNGGNVFVARWPIGIVSSGSVNFEGWSGGLTNATRGKYQAIYVSAWMKIEGPDFENNQSGVKLWYFSHGQVGTPASIWMIRQNAGGTGQYSNLAFHYYRNLVGTFQTDTTGKTGGERTLLQNVSSGAAFSCGSWHQLELLLRLNSAAGTADGVMRAWLDGVELMSYSNLLYTVPGAVAGFNGFRFDNIWGGGGPARTTTDELRFARWTVYGKP
ncbi:MAG: hypothetical protein R3B13_30040 [Polyangiaceae bacterium]